MRRGKARPSKARQGKEVSWLHIGLVLWP